MRTWVYSWMSSDGLRHEGEMNAPDKDSVYAELRKRGIHAIKVYERIAPVVRKGFAGLRKRDWSIIAIGLIALWVGFALFDDASKDEMDLRVVSAFAEPRPRRWLLLPKGANYSEIFRYPHEVYLAKYALPGVDSANSDEISSDLEKDFYDNLKRDIVIEETDDPSIAELKRIVVGMKIDALKYLSVPDGIKKLARWLEERQAMEILYRNQFSLRVERGELDKDDANAAFRAMGLEEL